MVLISDLHEHWVFRILTQTRIILNFKTTRATLTTTMSVRISFPVILKAPIQLCSFIFTGLLHLYYFPFHFYFSYLFHGCQTSHSLTNDLFNDLSFTHRAPFSKTFYLLYVGLQMLTPISVSWANNKDSLVYM